MTNTKSEFSHSKTSIFGSWLISIGSSHGKGFRIDVALVVDCMLSKILFSKPEDRLIGAKTTVDVKLSYFIFSYHLDESSWLRLYIDTCELHGIPFLLILILSPPSHKIFYNVRIEINGSLIITG